MFVAYPFNPTKRRARASPFSSRTCPPACFFTNRGVRGAFCPSITARARFSCVVIVLLSLAARFFEYAHTARHEDGNFSGSHTGSARLFGLLMAVAPVLGVIVSITCPSVDPL